MAPIGKRKGGSHAKEGGGVRSGVIKRRLEKDKKKKTPPLPKHDQRDERVLSDPAPAGHNQGRRSRAYMLLTPIRRREGSREGLGEA